MGMLPALLLLARAAPPRLVALPSRPALWERMGLRAAKVGGKVALVGGYTYDGRVCRREVGLVGPDGREEDPGLRLTVGRNHFEMLALSSSRLLVLGGYSEDHDTLADAQCLDLRTGRVEAWPWMPLAVELFTTHRYGDRLAVVCGLISQGQAQTRAQIQILDLKTREWSLAPHPLAHDRFGHASVWLPRLGRLLVAGGKRKSANDPRYASLASMEFWTPSTGEVASAGDLPVPTDRPGVCLLPSGKVMIVGGANDDEKLASVLVYDPWSRTCTPVGKLATPRMAPMLLRYRDEGVIIAGGWVDDAEAGRAIEYFDFATQTLSTIGRAEACRAEGQMLWQDAGTLVLAGGKDPFLGRNPHGYTFATLERFRVAN